MNYQSGSKDNTLRKSELTAFDGVASLADFEKLRTEIARKIPNNKRGLAGESLKEATARAWVAGYLE